MAVVVACINGSIGDSSGGGGCGGDGSILFRECRVPPVWFPCSHKLLFFQCPIPTPTLYSDVETKSGGKATVEKRIDPLYVHKSMNTTCIFFPFSSYVSYALLDPILYVSLVVWRLMGVAPLLSNRRV